MMQEVIESVYKNKIIAIVRGVNPDKCLKVAQALYDGGIRLMEITYNQSDRESWIETANTVNALVNYLGDKMYFGAGTVTNSDLVELTHNAGGQFIVSPNVNEKVIKKTKELDMVSIPGAMTPSEICNAYDFGADFIKLFPASDLGISYVKSVKAPLSNIPLLATGGITEENAKNFIDAGCTGLCIGGALTDKSAVKCGNFNTLTENAKRMVSIIK